jgi:hypothetical protein
MADENQRDGSFRVKSILRPLERLVALHVRAPGNRLCNKFPLDLLLEVEEHHIAIRLKPSLLKRIGRSLSGQFETALREIRLRVRLRYCYVRYRSGEMRIDPDSKYESAILEGKFEIRTYDKSYALKTSELAAGLSGRAAVTSQGPNASVGIRASRAFSRQHKNSSETLATKRLDIYEVQAVPDGWRIGHPEYGDPRKAAGCLEGRYFHRPVSGLAQTCEVQFEEGQNHGELTFVVTVRDGLLVERVDGSSTSRTDSDRATMMMRNRIAALEVGAPHGIEHSLMARRRNANCDGDL